MARLFFDNYIADDKTKIKTNFPYEHTLLNIPNDMGGSIVHPMVYR